MEKTEIKRLQVSLKETAAMLSIDTRSVRRLISRNKLKANRALRHIRIPIAEIERFVSTAE